MGVRLSPAILLIGLLAASSASAQDAVLYTVCDYQGLEYGMNISDGNVSNLEYFRDRVSSLKVSPGFRVTLYSQTNFQGLSEAFTGNVPCLFGSTIRNDNAESATLERTPSPSPSREPASPTPNATLAPTPSPTPTSTPSPVLLVSTPAPSPASPPPTPMASPAAASPPPAVSPTPRQLGFEALAAVAALGAAFAFRRKAKGGSGS